jgi:hypothetical protein
MRKTDGKPRWLRRRRLYAGGALMVLAPVGAGCDIAKPATDVPADPGTDVVDVAPDGFPEAVAVAPWDPGPVDIAIAPDLNGDPGFPEVIAIAPFDPGTEAIAIAPDIGPGDPQPEWIAIAPVDVGPADTYDGPMVIMPYDAGPTDVVQQPCLVEGEWCDAGTVCQAQAICIVPTPCCGGCKCEPMPCNTLYSDQCPEGSTCVVDSGTKGHCVRGGNTKPPGGFYAECTSDAECLQEYFCQQTMFCIAPAPGSGEKVPIACGQMNCVPWSCENGQACPAGSECVPYGGPFYDLPAIPGMPDAPALPALPKTCVRAPGKVPAGYGAACNSKACIAAQYRCQDTAMCILPTDCCLCECLPVPCNLTSPVSCTKDETCTDVGITTVCVKNPL